MIDFDALMNTAPPMLSVGDAEEMRDIAKMLLNASNNGLTAAVEFDPDFAQTVAMTLLAGVTELEDEITRLTKARKTRLEPTELRAIAKDMESAMRGTYGLVAREKIQRGASALRVIAMELEENQ